MKKEKKKVIYHTKEDEVLASEIITGKYLVIKKRI